MPKPTKFEKRTHEHIAVGAAMGASLTSSAHQAATNATIDGVGIMRDLASRTSAKLPATQRGHLFEAILAMKKNVEAARAGTSARTTLTHLEGNHTAAADLRTTFPDGTTSLGQAKFIVSTSKCARELADPKYKGMDRLVPANKVTDVRSELRRLAENATDPAARDGYIDAERHLVSHDTGTGEVWFAQRNTRMYAWCQDTKAIGVEALSTGGQAAVGAALASAVFSAVHQCTRLYRGEATASEAASQFAKTTGKGAAKGFAAGFAGGAIRGVAQRAGLPLLKKANVATAAGCAMLESGCLIWDYARGDVSAEELALGLGRTGTSFVANIYVGSAIGMVFGPVGAVVGGMMAHVLVSCIYESSLAIFKNASLAAEEAARIEALCDASIAEIRRQREDFNSLFGDHLHRHQVEFEGRLAAVDKAMIHEGPLELVNALAEMAETMGFQLQHLDLDEFDTFMKDPATTLTI